jgi:hypothetical protein
MVAGLVDELCGEQCKGDPCKENLRSGDARGGDPCKGDPSGTTWRGHDVVVADATSASLPDVPALQALWPQPGGQRPGLGFPVVKLLGLLHLETGLIRQLSIMSLHVHGCGKGDIHQCRPLTAHRYFPPSVRDRQRGHHSFLLINATTGRHIDLAFALGRSRLLVLGVVLQRRLLAGFGRLVGVGDDRLAGVVLVVGDGLLVGDVAGVRHAQPPGGRTPLGERMSMVGTTRAASTLGSTDQCG